MTERMLALDYIGGPLRAEMMSALVDLHLIYANFFFRDEDGARVTCLKLLNQLNTLFRAMADDIDMFKDKKELFMKAHVDNPIIKLYVRRVMELDRNDLAKTTKCMIEVLLSQSLVIKKAEQELGFVVEKPDSDNQEQEAEENQYISKK